MKYITLVILPFSIFVKCAIINFKNEKSFQNLGDLKKCGDSTDDKTSKQPDLNSSVANPNKEDKKEEEGKKEDDDKVKDKKQEDKKQEDKKQEDKKQEDKSDEQKKSDEKQEKSDEKEKNYFSTRRRRKNS
ncbi:hypothetical protein EDEG_00296 [Edhazardia aedis USNM 41457]|uniref:Uncharacterized protein n=1 Tax=Edhazardia aedis (strain USNM 41457) TaxID=1003232 RepID=J9D440_EDHAE|nr:hypothetical protein EDEG_00296 [Edhazardia aedis USNM 41457]|eukprot:EJW02319.1 hypothetical protein EDEG_00296 [Edhazardia aedis USNM 41457]